jgi:hypothetical protein
MGRGDDPERYHGEYDTMEQAISQGRLEQTDFTIVEACVPQKPNNPFLADSVWEDFLDANEGVLDPDEGLYDLSIYQLADEKAIDQLQSNLGDVLIKWMEQHGVQYELFGFAQMRNKKYFPMDAPNDPMD